MGKTAGGGAKQRKEFTVGELVAKAEALVDQCQPELAVQFYERALQKESTNVALLDLVGELHTELGNPERAAEAFKRSIQLEPTRNPSKWLYLAQLVPGEQAEQYATQGIAYLQQELAQHASQPQSQDAQVIKKQIGDAYCSLGELYMTDLCDEDDAEQRCEGYFAEAMKYDIGLPEPIQALANLRLTQQRKDEAVELLEETYRRLMENCDENSLPSLEFRVFSGKLMIEAELYEQAADVLEGVMQEDDENAELWFLVGTCYRAMDDLSAALEFFQKCHELLAKLKKELRHEFHLGEQLESVVETIASLQTTIANRAAEGDNDDDDDGDDGEEEEAQSHEEQQDVEMEE